MDDNRPWLFLCVITINLQSFYESFLYRRERSVDFDPESLAGSPILLTLSLMYQQAVSFKVKVIIMFVCMALQANRNRWSKEI